MAFESPPLESGVVSDVPRLRGARQYSLRSRWCIGRQSGDFRLLARLWRGGTVHVIFRAKYPPYYRGEIALARCLVSIHEYSVPTTIRILRQTSREWRPDFHFEPRCSRLHQVPKPLKKRYKHLTLHHPTSPLT